MERRGFITALVGGLASILMPWRRKPAYAFDGVNDYISADYVPDSLSKEGILSGWLRDGKPEGQWRHIAVVRNESGSITVYVNGVVSNAVTFDRALTPAEIWNIYTRDRV